MRPPSFAAIVRHEPYRLFFPLGAALGAIGVGWWLVWWADQTFAHPPELIYRGHEHALVQAQGFLLAFVVGFLGTMLPRRTATPKATPAALAASALSLVVTVVALVARRPVVAEASAFALAGAWLVFALRRVATGAGRRPPEAFVLIPLGLAQAAIGSGLLALAALGKVGSTGVTIASGLVTEGSVLTLVLGVGRFVLPLLHGHEVPPDAGPSAASRRARAGWTLAGLLIVGSFPLQALLAADGDPVLGLRLGYAVRGAVALAALLATRAWRRPTVAGTQRTLLWISAWFVPAGLLLAAARPALRFAFLHVTTIGGFGLMALAVGAHVVLAHGGHEELVERPSRALRWFGGLVLFALTTRVSADMLPDTYLVHLAGASLFWLVGLAVWVAFLVPKALGPRGDGKPVVPAGSS